MRVVLYEWLRQAKAKARQVPRGKEDQGTASITEIYTELTAAPPLYICRSKEIFLYTTLSQMDEIYFYHFMSSKLNS